MSLKNQDWADKKHREYWSNQYRMEMADEQLPKGGNPIATLAAICLIAICASLAIWTVLLFKDVIDSSQPVYGTQIDRSTIILHERAAGLRP